MLLTEQKRHVRKRRLTMLRNIAIQREDREGHDA